MRQALFIRSQDRTVGSSTNFLLQLPKTYNNVRSYEVASAEIPFSWNNMAAPYLAGVSVTYAGTTLALTLPAGQYALSDLQSQLLTALQALFSAAGFTAVNFTARTGQLSVTYTGGGTLSVANNASGALGQILGTNATTTTSSSGVLTFPGYCQLFPTSTLLLNIQNLPPAVLCTNGLACSARMQVGVAPSGVQLINNSTNSINFFQFPSPIPTLNQLTVLLQAADGSQLNLNGCEWSFCLLLEYDA